MRRRWHRGQTLVIFALSLTVLLGLAGLSIDISRAYDLYARMQRAAEAGASAGVLYLPLYYSTARIPGDGLSAVNRASIEIVKNGFGAAIPVGQTDCPSPPTSVEVAICQVSGQPNDLQITITEHVSLVLASGLGLAPITLTTKAQAEYLPPVQLGSRSNYFGDEVECSTSNPADPANSTPCDVGGSGAGRANNHLQYFMATMNGPGELKEFGDPMVNCEEGNSNNPVQDGPAASYTDYNQYQTNNPVWSSSAAVIQTHCGPPVPGVNPGNSDQQPPGYDSPATDSTPHPGGYNYAVVVPSDGASLWVFNPTFIATNHNYVLTGEAGRGLDFFFEQPNGPYSMTDPFGGGLDLPCSTCDYVNFDAPPLYFTMTYTLYSVTNVYDRTSDQLMSSQAYPPYDAIDADISVHSCNPGQIYDPYYSGGNTKNTYHGSPQPTMGCFPLAPKTQGTPPSWETGATAPCWLAWCMIQSNLAAGTYRLVVEATGLRSKVSEYHSSSIDGWGTHYYALKVCATSAIGSPVGSSCTTGGGGGVPGVSLSAWNNLDVNFTTSLSTAAASSSNPATSCVQTSGTPYACLDLACVPAAYAGRLLSVGLYDPGDGFGGDLFIGVVAPSGSGVKITYPPWVSVTTAGPPTDGDAVVHAHFTTPSDYTALNGLWLSATISLPPTYAGTCVPGGASTGWFQIVYLSSTGGNPRDWVGISFNLIGSPVHLVLPS